MMQNSTGDDDSINVWNDACFNTMFSGVSFLAGANQSHHPLSPSLFGGGYISDALTFPSGTTSFYSPVNPNFVAECSDSSDSAFFKMPESEPMKVHEQTESNESMFVFHDSTSFPHLPGLRSLEQCSSSINKRARFDRVDSVWNPMLRVCESFQNHFLASPDSTAVQVHRSALARQRRQKLSDKTRCLQKLLPWDKKMDIATMLEEAFKYVKFLQAQLLALQSMPCESAISTNSNRYISGGLERLNRNQLLQVLVNSPVAQTMLCSQSCCVFSAEQLGFIQKFAEKRALMQQMWTLPHKP